MLCDINLTNYCLDVDRLESLITNRTKVIIPVHYAGQTADMDRILELANRHGLTVLEDAAEAHLARYRDGKFAGTIGNMGIFSFTPTKPMTTGEGGMIVTDDDRLAEQCRLIRNFGDSGKFQWDLLGFNYRLNEVAAAVGICQLRKLPQIIAMRREKRAATTRPLPTRRRSSARGFAPSRTSTTNSIRSASAWTCWMPAVIR